MKFRQVTFWVWKIRNKNFTNFKIFVILSLFVDIYFNYVIMLLQ